MTLHTLLTLPSLALETSAKALRLLAHANEVLATKVAAAAQDNGNSDGQHEVAAPPSTTPLTAPAATTSSVAADSPAASTDDLPRDIATLAALPSSSVLRAVDTLSSTELADLYEFESKHRRRRTVLQAVEAALAPPASAAVDDELLDEVRVPDELVYSTSTPRR